MLRGTACLTTSIAIASHYVLPTLCTCGGRGMLRSMDSIYSTFRSPSIGLIQYGTGPTFTGLRRGRPDDDRLEDAMGCDIRCERIIRKTTAKPTHAK